ncbi:MAG: S9 family peptidase, partial [Phaeodactylibacter sp.]|nr:S9 family peptidase [Phaeodactylibacter sp.]
MRNYLPILICLFIHSAAQAQSVPNQSPLTIETIMQGEKFVGYSPENIFWSEDSKTVYFDWNPELDSDRSLYKTDPKGTAPVKVSLEEERQLSGRGTYSKDGKRKLYTKYGDLFLWNSATDNTLRLTNTIEEETDPIFVMDEAQVCYRRGNDLFVLD